MHFPDDVRRVLSRAGWSPNRRVDVASWEAVVAAEEWEFVKPARGFLTRFGGLDILWPGPDGSARELVLGITPELEDPARYEEATGVRLTPVGLGFSGHYTFFIGADGAMYGAFDGDLGRWGADATEGLTVVLRNERPNPITGF
ncbi:MAG: SUKH-3 domain-containing protein [Propionibacteriaceae bacterium]|nr:SUKH-3 domain-containing protein [Propionibacteriaceae bacterium]